MLAWHLPFFLRSNLAILLIQILRRRGIHTYNILLAAFLDFFLARNCAVICMQCVSFNGWITGYILRARARSGDPHSRQGLDKKCFRVPP